MNPTAMRIADVQTSYEDYRYRTPIKFGGVALDRVTLLNVTVIAKSTTGKEARGFGSMPLGNVWSFPSRALTYEQTLGAMKDLAERVAAIVRAFPESGHPIDLNWAMEHAFFEAAAKLSRELSLCEAIPPLCTLVTASPFDAALHDAFGKLHGLNSYHTYGREFLEDDLGKYLGPEFAGDRLEQYLMREPRSRLPLYHLVGALDPLEQCDVQKPVGDGLPETLSAWISDNGLTHLKIKLNGQELGWDVQRVVRVDRVTSQAQKKRGIEAWHYSLDFNERCPDVAYLIEFVRQLNERNPRAFGRVQYIEQPTARDLQANRSQRMHEVSKMVPVVIDESLIDLASLQLARQMGYTGAALKTCKGQTQSLLMAAAAQKYGMFLCMQDLTCPGASLIHSAGLAARVPGVAAIEANARQYVPAANAQWAGQFPGVFDIIDGMVETGSLTGLGLGAVPVTDM